MEEGGAIWFPTPGGVPTRAAPTGPLTHRQATEMTRKISQNMTPAAATQDNPFKFGVKHPPGPGPLQASAAPFQLWQGPGGSYVLPNSTVLDQHQLFYPPPGQPMVRTPSPEVDLPTLAALKPLFSLTVEDVCALLRCIDGKDRKLLPFPTFST